MKRGDITAEGKRYYWLKMKEDFFSSKRIKKLRKMAGGDTYTIIYLKMQLLSLKTDGVLTWTGLEEDFASELALDLDETPEDVKVVLMYLSSCGLIETSDEVNFLLPYVVANTGSETASTQRSREFRERHKALQRNTNATQVQRICNAEKEIENRDREKRKEIEKEGLIPSEEGICQTDVQRIVDAWNTLGLQQVQKVTMTSKRGQMLRARLNEYGVDAVLQAIEKVRESDFLKGGGGKDFIITFDWFVKPNNFPKVLEGNYDNRHGKKTTGTNNIFLEMLGDEYGQDADN